MSQRVSDKNANPLIKIALMEAYTSIQLRKVTTHIMFTGEYRLNDNIYHTSMQLYKTATQSFKLFSFIFNNSPLKPTTKTP